jgi:hypothetical protein
MTVYGSDGRAPGARGGGRRLGIAGSLALGLFACSYQPPNPADTARPTYQSDLDACLISGNKEAHRLVMSYGYLFMTYPLSFPIEGSVQVRKCMQAKGYAAK